MFLRWRRKRNFGINTKLNIKTGTGAPREYVLISACVFPHIHDAAAFAVCSLHYACNNNKEIDTKTIHHWNRNSKRHAHIQSDGERERDGERYDGQWGGRVKKENEEETNGERGKTDEPKAKI